VDGDLLLDGAPRGLVVGEALLRGGDARLRRVEPGVERFLALGLVGELLSRCVGGGVEPLESDQPFEVSMHRPTHCTWAGPAAQPKPSRDVRAVPSEGWAHQDLNLEPADYEPAALTVELWAHPSLGTAR